jgi:cyclophilin family peptidyl-prolyl cis-trans isomerase
MQKYCFLFSFTVLMFSCQTSNQYPLMEIQKLEYLRQPDGAKFIPWLNSKNPKIREKAVESLGRIQDTSTVSWVANRMVDKDDSVRSMAAFAMGQFFSLIAEEPLISVLPYEKNSMIRSKMIEALGKTGNDKASVLIRNAIESNAPELERAGAISFGIIAYRGYPLHSISGSLSTLLSATSDPSVSWRSAYGLYRSASFSEFNTLIKLLTSSDAMTRFFSLKAQATIINYLKSPQAEKHRGNELLQKTFATIQTEDYLNSLRQTLQDSCWYVKVAALQVCEILVSLQLFPEIKACCSDANEQVRTVAIQTITSFKSSEAVNFLTNLFNKSNDWREKGLALLQLSQLRPQSSLKLIRNSLSNRKWPENYYLIKALEQIENQESTRILQELLNADEKAQMTLVLESLVNRSGIPVSILVDKLSLNDAVVTTIVASKLALIKDRQFVPPLVDAYQQFRAPQDVETLLAILAALDSIPDPRANALLEKEAGSPYSSIRKAAASALSRLNPEASIISPLTDLPLTRQDFLLVQENLNPRIKFTTSKGEFEIVLYPQKAPATVSNFIELVNAGFYNGIYFHRVVPGFVIQAGDPRGDGWGGPGYSIPCEYNDIFYERGVVGMAHAGKDTGGSQFFITHTPQPHLNGRHTAFGRVVSGLEVTDRIEIYDRIIRAELIH